jgi:hypothetical protein
MKKKISYEKEHHEELKSFHRQIQFYLNYIDTSLVLTREYTDYLYKNNLKRQMPGAHLHHIIPRACGGTDEKINLIWLTKDCHCEVHAILCRDTGKIPPFKVGYESVQK